MNWKKSKLTLFVKILLAAVIFLFGAGAGYYYSARRLKPAASQAEKDVYLAFLDEVYETVKENYWKKISDEQLSNLFVRGVEKLSGQPQALDKPDKANLDKFLAKISRQIEDPQKKKEFAAKLADIVLANLEPFGRSRLYTKKEEVDLKNRVENINPETGEKEPTLDSRLLRPEILYLHLKKFSSTTFEELQNAVKKADLSAKSAALDTLILDLRDNVGGAIDGLPYFLGPFIGNEQYAYQFFHQDEKTDFKTKVGWLPALVRYKKVVILINKETQSSAEVMATVLKKYNAGVLLGAPSKGWGTVEKVFPMKQELDSGEKHSIFLVHSLTLREDGQPIEGRGVEPLINIEQADWEEQLYHYFHYPELAAALKEIL